MADLLTKARAAMSGWNRWDWAFTVGPFIVLAAIAAYSVRAYRKTQP